MDYNEFLEGEETITVYRLNCMDIPKEITSEDILKVILFFEDSP